MNNWKQNGQQCWPSFSIRRLTLDQTECHQEIKVYIETTEVVLEYTKRSRSDIIQVLMTGVRGEDSHLVSMAFMKRLIALGVDITDADQIWVSQDIEPEK
ncbi:MAG: hypothetical protein UY48_C0008G0003 [Candidatus Gottesmanbacteria bacterium GW2011_GWB1_49_7]|uniref:Uncharacterized protein n=1 Tax=Candidatus Gottesmanbacteria bacterium GW2011_GWB1_49_7 TaxID=1618448 RepID=A0A0G1W287_9BACT|nr:MAG: hypothetical protein UY48_C0008G0003 [Candidatus Gottesmanbacteria bacterium GW2011_GWB1_49_7]